jgi:hypothetical protein
MVIPVYNDRSSYTQFYIHVENYCQFVSISQFQSGIVEYSQGVKQLSTSILDQL